MVTDVQQSDSALSVWISRLRVWQCHSQDGFVLFMLEGIQNGFGFVCIDHGRFADSIDVSVYASLEVIAEMLIV